MTFEAAETMQSYSRLRDVRPAERIATAGVAEVAAVFSRAAHQRREVTLRGGGRSFDDQALNHDLVVDVRARDQVGPIDPTRREVTVEGGAAWGSIVDATLSRGFMPHIVVTASRATAAGAVSSNALSRCSPRYGHTGDHVRSLTLLTVQGEQITCSRDENVDVFRAVIGGFGWFGLITHVTFDLLPVGARRSVRTVVDRREGLAPFVERLIEASLQPAPYDAVYSVYSLAAPQRGAVFRSAYSDEPVGRTLSVYRPYSWYRPLAELLFVSSRVSRALCQASYLYEFGRGPFVDDLRGYTFCMDGNERTKALADRAGVRLGSIQHSYAVPTGALLFFLEESARLFRAHDVYPCLLDALYRPRDDYLLSSSNGLDGFCVSYVFEGVGRRRFEHVRRCLTELNDVAANLGARLHLAKNVYATSAQLQRMYAYALDELSLLKTRLDPSGVLVNDFFTRAFSPANNARGPCGPPC